MQDHSLTLVATHLGHGIVQTWALYRHSLHQLGMLIVERQRRRVLADGAAGDVLLARGSVRRLVCREREVVLCPEGYHSLIMASAALEIDRPEEIEHAAFARVGQRLAQRHRPHRLVHVRDDSARLDWIGPESRVWGPLDHVAVSQEGDLFALGEVQVKDFASLFIRGSRRADEHFDRLGAAAREHVSVGLPLSVVIVVFSPFVEGAQRKDVGAGRDLSVRVRLVEDADVKMGPAFAAKIPSEAVVVVVSGEFPDFLLQIFDRVDGAGQLDISGVFPGTQPVRFPCCGTTQASFASIANGR